MKAHTGAADVYYHSSLTSAFNESEWLTSRLSRFNPREVTQLIRCLSGSQSQSRRFAQEIHSSPVLVNEPLIVQPLAITLSGLQTIPTNTYEYHMSILFPLAHCFQTFFPRANPYNTTSNPEKLQSIKTDPILINKTIDTN